MKGVFLEGDAGEAALLGTVMHQSILTNVQVSTSRAAPPPVIRLAFEQIFLIRIMPVDAAVRPLGNTTHLVVNPSFLVTDRAQLPITVVNDSDSAREA